MPGSTLRLLAWLRREAGVAEAFAARGGQCPRGRAAAASR
jgi:hypothetical protein